MFLFLIVLDVKETMININSRSNKQLLANNKTNPKNLQLDL